MKPFTSSQVTVGSTIFAQSTSARISGNWVAIFDKLTIAFITPTGRINADGPRGRATFAPNGYNKCAEPFGKTRNIYTSVYVAENSAEVEKAESDRCIWEAETKAAREAAAAEKAKRFDDRMAKMAEEKAAAMAANQNPIAASIFGTPFWTVKITTCEGYERDVVFTMTPSMTVDWTIESTEPIKKATVEVEGWMAAHPNRPRSTYNFSLATAIVTEGKSPSQVVFETVTALIERLYTTSI
jgi:hypothetical protein